MKQNRALILRGNRFLGAALVDRGLVASADLEAANEKFMEAIQNPEAHGDGSILRALVHDLKVLDEAKLLEHIVEEHGIGLIDLSFIDLPPMSAMGLDFDTCRATSTVPFDRVEGTYLMATSFYLSAPVIKYWNEQLDGNLVWYGTSVASIAGALERFEDLKAAEEAAALEAEADG